MKIEVGKTYLDKLGSEVKIIRHEPKKMRPFLGNDECRYTSEGRFHPHIRNKYDLIKEAPGKAA